MVRGLSLSAGPNDRTTGDSSKKGKAGLGILARAGECSECRVSSCALFRRMGESSYPFARAYRSCVGGLLDRSSRTGGYDPRPVPGAPRPLALDGVWKSCARGSHALVLGVANGAWKRIPRDGVDVGSNGDSSYGGWPYAPPSGLLYTRDASPGTSGGVDGPAREALLHA